MLNLKLSRQTQCQSPKVVIVRFAGEVEASNGLQVEQYFERMLQEEQPRHVLLDLGEMTYASSVFFSSVLFWKKQLTRHGGQLVLYGMRPEIASTMRIMGLEQVLTVRTDQPDAVEAVSGKQ